MKILAISTSALPSPSNGYGGLENVLYDTCEGMAILGHEVTLITTNDSSKLGIHEAVGADGKSTGGVLDVKTAGPGGWGIQFERDMYINYREFMENQFGDGQGLILSMNWFGYPYLSLGGWRNVQSPNGQIIDIPAHPKMKMIHVIHGTTGLGGQRIPSTIKFPRLVGVSRPQASFLGSQFGFPVRYIHNGIKIPPKPESWPPHEDFYLSLNRIAPEKGILHAIDVAVANGERIKCVGDSSWVPDQNYVYDVITRCENSGGLAEFVGNVDNETKWDLIRRCKGIIACPDGNRGYLEAFYLGAVESLACGRPVYAVANGGINDIIQNNVNGILATNPQRLTEILKSAPQIDPDVCYESSLKFSSDNMVAGYIKMAEGVMSGSPEWQW